MERRILEFAGVLRNNGIRVSTAETLEGMQAAELLGLADRAVFKDALRATMVKRTPDIESFDRLFEVYFSGLGNLIQEMGGAAAGGMSDSDFQDLLDQLAELMKDMDPELSDLARALVLQDTGALEQLLREMMESGTVPAVDSPTQMPAAIRAMMDRLVTRLQGTVRV